LDPNIANSQQPFRVTQELICLESESRESGESAHESNENNKACFTADEQAVFGERPSQSKQKAAKSIHR